jgi:hypothetical protein
MAIGSQVSTSAPHQNDEELVKLVRIERERHADNDRMLRSQAQRVSKPWERQCLVGRTKMMPDSSKARPTICAPAGATPSAWYL